MYSQIIGKLGYCSPEEERCQEWSFEPWLYIGEAHVCGGYQRGLDQCGQNILELGQRSRAWRVRQSVGCSPT